MPGKERGEVPEAEVAKGAFRASTCSSERRDGRLGRLCNRCVQPGDGPTGKERGLRFVRAASPTRGRAIASRGPREAAGASRVAVRSSSRAGPDLGAAPVAPAPAEDRIRVVVRMETREDGTVVQVRLRRAAARETLVVVAPASPSFPPSRARARARPPARRTLGRRQSCLMCVFPCRR